MIHFPITAYIGRDVSPKMPYIKSHDTGVTFDISIISVCNSSKWRDIETPFIIPDGCKAVFRASKPDKTVVLTDKDITIENNVIICQLVPQALTVVGVCNAEIQLYGTDGKRLTSATFQYEVGAECVCDGDKPSADYIDLLSKEISRTVEAVEKAERIASHPPKVSDNGTWLEWDDQSGAYVDTGVSCTKGKDGKDYVLTEADKTEIAEDAAMLSTVGRYATVSAASWSDDTDLLSVRPRAQRVAYKTSNAGSTVDIIQHNWNDETDTILSEDWQTFDVSFTYSPTDYTGGLYLLFYGGKSDVFCHPYDIADVKLWLTSDAEQTNLFPEDIAKLNWWWHYDTESCIAVNRFSVAYDEDGHKYIHVWRQNAFESASGKVTNANLAYLRAGTGVKLTAGETYTLSVRMRTTCRQHTAIAECEGIRDHSATVVSPVPTSTVAFLNNGVRAFGQRIGELMLKADTKPNSDITVAIQASRGQGTGVIINTVMPEITGALDNALLNTIGSGVIS